MTFDTRETEDMQATYAPGDAGLDARGLMALTDENSGTVEHRIAVIVDRCKRAEFEARIQRKIDAMQRAAERS